MLEDCFFGAVESYVRISTRRDLSDCLLDHGIGGVDLVPLVGCDLSTNYCASTLKS